MKPVSVALFSLVALAAIALPLAQAVRAEPAGDLCEQMTPSRMLENPRIAKRWAEALRSKDPEAVARMRELFAHLRAVHGCDSASPSPDESGKLPPGHPPIDGAPTSPSTPVFEAPGALTI